jgi:hypothetical protein
MNAISVEDALSIFAKWREENSRLYFCAGGSGRIESQSSTVQDINGTRVAVLTRVDGFPAVVFLDLSLAASLKYGNEREAVLRDESVPRPVLDTLSIDFPDGRNVMVLYREFPEKQESIP